MNIRTWHILPLDKDAAVKLAQEYDLPLFLAMLLTIRSEQNPGLLQQVLQKEPVWQDPFSLRDMDRAAQRIHRAIDNFEKIAVYGDYDVDGVTATALLYSYLEACEADVLYYLPDRDQEGYGMNEDAIEHLHTLGVKLIITVDNGIASVKETALAKTLSMDVVITDHHRPQGELPQAVAVVDPYRAEENCSYRHYAGVGVAFKLVEALEEGLSTGEELLEDYADLLCLGTIGDVVPVDGENRYFVQRGLEALRRTQRPGLMELLTQSGVAEKQLTTTNVAFTLVPRINAAGRMGTADSAVRLLLCEQDDEAVRMAQEMCEANEQRRKTETEILEKVQVQLTQHPEWLQERVLVLEGSEWHHGVIGIVAARVTEKYGKPCILLSRFGDVAKGSGRSVEGFSLFEAVHACADLLVKYGGHPMAAGLTLESRYIEEFRKRINDYARKTCDCMPAPMLTVDCKLNPAALNITMPQEAMQLSPFGAGNPEPLYALLRMKIDQIIPVGNGNHLRLVCTRDGAQVSAMKFFTTLQQFSYAAGDEVDLAVTLDAREYRGEKNLSVIVKDIRPAGMEMQEQVESYRLWEKLQRGEGLFDEQAARLLPTREDFAAVYRFLKKNGGWQKNALLLCKEFSAVGLGKLLLMLDIFAERGLMEYQLEEESIRISLRPVEGKVDLFASPLYSRAAQKIS